MKFQILLSQLPTSPEEFKAGYDFYCAEKEAHKKTEGVPAPWPQFEIYRSMYDQGVNQIEVLDDRPRLRKANLIIVPEGIEDPRDHSS